MKRQRSDGGLDTAVNMDAMMDNMTAVVGTLLMVLIIVQLQVNHTIDQIQSNLPEVTQEESLAAQEDARKLEQQLQQVQAAWTQREPQEAQLQQDLQAKQQDLQRFTATLKKTNAEMLELAEAKKQLEERRKQVEAAKAELAKLIDEREKLKGLLDDSPPPAEPPAKIVRLPAALPIPPQAQLTRVLCANGRVYVEETAMLKEQVLNAFQRSRAVLVKEIGAPAPDKDNNIYDHEKTAELLEKRTRGNARYELKFPVIKTQDRLRMEMRPKPDAGETPEEFASARSHFANTVRRVKRHPQGVIWFLVYRDSLETYLAARQLCDEVGVPAGWEMTGAPYFYENLTEFKVNRLEQPPPPAKNVLAIPAPTKTID